MRWNYEEAAKCGCFLCETHEFGGEIIKLDLSVFNGRPKRYERDYVLCDECAKKIHRILNAVKIIRKD